MLIYITGGARSGKSRYALDLAKRLAKKVVFVATCFPNDADLRRRIQWHRNERPKHWRTIENTIDLAGVFSTVDKNTQLILIDCLTMYVSWRLMQKEDETKIAMRIEKLCKNAVSSPMTTLIVSNEVGSGLVPPTELGRKFRDYAGRANQIVARYAQEAYVLISGIPLPLKPATTSQAGPPRTQWRRSRP
jgi:adenosylcobinamide kinase/adenosylcobinamide-phosphate guanylyltransferase